MLAPADPGYRLPPVRKYLLLQQLGGPACLLDPDIQSPARLGDLVRLGAQISDPDGGNLLQLAAQLPGPADSPAASAGVGDSCHQPVLSCVPIPHGECVGERETR